MKEEVGRVDPARCATLSEVKDHVHEHWGYASPYRMGLVARELGYGGANPYGKNSNAYRLFKDGYDYAAERQRRPDQGAR